MNCHSPNSECINHGACNTDGECMFIASKRKYDKDKKFEEQVEALAKKLYEHWVTPELHQFMYGEDKPAWQLEGITITGGTDPNLDLAEHQRDDYRDTARALLKDREVQIKVKTKK